MAKCCVLLLVLVLAQQYQSLTTRGCKSVISQGLTAPERNRILDQHNVVRRLVARGEMAGQLKGVNLRRMKWDVKLAEEAQRAADKCETDHDVYQDERWDFIGQNIKTYVSQTPEMADATWDGAIESWLSSRMNFNYSRLDINCFCLEYTQLVWAETEYLGCGMKHFETNIDDPKYVKFFVCNYGPGGNIIDEYPYRAGNRGCQDLC